MTRARVAGYYLQTLRKEEMKMRLEYNGRTVDCEIDGVDTKDYPDFCDAYSAGAWFEDTGEPLTCEQIEELNYDSKEEINEAAFESLF